MLDGRSADNRYIVHLHTYEGPLDLLLDLIKKNKMDIYNIQVSEITKDYMRTLEEMKDHDIDITSEFTELASLLLFVKSQYLLKKPDDPDPRDELVRRITAYQEVKEQIVLLRSLEEKESLIFRSNKTYVGMNDSSDVSKIFSLYTHVLNRTKKDKTKKLDRLQHNIMQYKYQTESYLEMMKQRLRKQPIFLEDFFSSIDDWEESIVSFFCILEIIKSHYGFFVSEPTPCVYIGGENVV